VVVARAFFDGHDCRRGAAQPSASNSRLPAASARAALVARGRAAIARLFAAMCENIRPAARAEPRS
jgi:hypothetical protein